MTRQLQAMKIMNFAWIVLLSMLHSSSAFVVRQQPLPSSYGQAQTKRWRPDGTCLFSTSEKKPTKSESNTVSSFSTPYPTARGSEVDSRKIVASGAAKQHLMAVRIQHILLATQDMADMCMLEIRAAKANFADLAEQLSACEFTRDKGGSIGWVSLSAKQHQKASIITDADDNEHLDEIIPKEARDLIVQITTKPGDVCIVQSPRGYHLVQIVDVMADVRKMATTKERRNKSKQKNEEDWLSTADQLTYKMETMGCQMNMADSERIEGQLQNLGIRPHDDDSKKDPDIVVLNTCSIREHAEHKVYSYIGPHAKRKREGEDVTIIVAGCVAQQEGLRLLRKAPEVDMVMGPQYANRIGDLLEDVRAYGNQVVATEATHIMEDSTKPRRQSSVAAWVNVIYGCNERCTFCIVPTTRGIEQSRPVESILDEVQSLVAEGYKEVTLLGQNIDAYGRDMIPKRKFSDLLRAVGNTPGLKRLRFVTSHPRYMSMGVVDAVAETEAACEFFHIPFQSGSNKILAEMGRGHTREKYLRIIDRIRAKIPDAAITADVIVGFPGETEEDFQETLSLMERVKFDTVNTAAYSPRPNTPAAEWENQLDDEVKQERLQRINQLNKEHARERRSRMMGRTVEVLVEERNVKLPTQVMGRTRHGYIVYFPGEIDELRGKLVNVEIDRTETFFLSGNIVDCESNQWDNFQI